MLLKVIFLTDLDETLLTKEHQNYEDLRKLLLRISTKAFVIPVTMKTLSEVLILSKRVEFTFPFIISEGGCVIAGINHWFLPVQGEYYQEGNYHVSIICKRIEDVDKTVSEILDETSCSDNVVILNKEPVDRIQQIIDLPVEDAKAMKSRLCSEVLFIEDAKCLLKLTMELAKYGFTVLKTQRFLHVLSGGKEQGVQTLLSKLKYFSDQVIAAGDSEIDCEFLGKSDTPLLIGGGLTCIRRYPYIVLPYKPITRNPTLDKVLSSIGL